MKGVAMFMSAVTVLIGLLTYFFIAPAAGIADAFGRFLFTVMLILFFKVIPMFQPLVKLIPIKSATALVFAVLILLAGTFTMGWFGNINLASVFGQVSPSIQTGPGVSLCSSVAQGGKIPDDVYGTTATWILNAYDFESRTPYSAAVDLTTNCGTFKNAHARENFNALTTDTSDGTLAGLAVGHNLIVYCGGTGYYTEPAVGVCTESQRSALSLNSHLIAPAASMNVTIYDSTGAAELTAGTKTAANNCNDYNITMGANENRLIYLRPFVNTANASYKVGALGIARFFNISDVTPKPFSWKGEQYSWTPGPSGILSTSGILIDANESSAIGTDAVRSDYVMWVLDKPLLLHNWEFPQLGVIPLEVRTTANDPVGGATVCSGTSVNGFAIMFKDFQFSRSGAGLYTENFYQGDTEQGDVGLNENETSPFGRESGAFVLVL